MIRVPLEQLFDENKRPMPGAGEIVIPGATMSLMAERDLLACYLDIANMWARLVRGRVIPAWKTPQIGDAAGGVAADADGSQLQWLIDQVDREVQARVIYQTERMGRGVTGAANRQRLSVIAKTKSATGLDISPFIRMSDVEGILRDSIRENTALITNLSQDAKRRVEQVIFNGFAFRWNKKRITDEIAKAMGITKRRARTIATDQSHKLQARLNQFRNEQMGIKEYIWRTMRDDRVRKEHAEREGKRFRWSSPPPDGNPGEPINCRCSSEGIFRSTRGRNSREREI